jgi:hypothetical protein
VNDADRTGPFPEGGESGNARSAQDLAGRIRDDQRARWRRGEPLRVEGYLNQHPRLWEDSEVVLELIFNEVELRRELGERPEEAEYVARFSHWAPRLRDLFQAFRVFDAGVSGQVSGPGEAADAAAENGAPFRVPRYQLLR